MALSCAIDVLRAANTGQQDKSYQWTLFSETGGPVDSSSGLELNTTSISDPTDMGLLAICGGERTHLFTSNVVINWLKQLDRKGVRLGTISDGGYLLAEAGLFDNHRSTIHWKCQTAYRERFPHLDVRVSILEIDGQRFSCAGGTASLDLFLGLLRPQIGDESVARIADNYFHDVIRGDNQVQHLTSAFRFAGRNKVLSDALLLMEGNLEAPLSIGQIGIAIGTSTRQLDRVFRRHLNTSPSQHYREMRLLRASELLKQTSISVTEIAAGCGFQSASHLSRYFKSRFGETPLEHRRAL